MRNAHLISELISASLVTRNATPMESAQLASWVSKAIDLYSMELSNEEQILLIDPVKELTYPQLSFIVKHVGKQLGGFPLLVADDLNPKFRSLFTKNGIPFIYRDKSVYSPGLGLKIFNHKSPKSRDTDIVDFWLSPFEIKLIAGYLSGFIEDSEFNLNDLEAVLSSHDYSCSKSKLSPVVNRLIKTGYAKAKGAGPNRTVRFLDKDEVWHGLLAATIKPFFKTYELPLAIDPEAAVLSHESALAHYSSLAHPKVTRVAMTSAQYLNVGESPRGQQSGTTIIDVFKEPPGLFSIEGKWLNPVELFLQMRGMSDERIQLSLEEMLESFHIVYQGG